MKSLPTFSTRRGKPAPLPILCALVLLCAVLSMCLGAVSISPGEILPALLGEPESTAARIVRYARLPRS